jgi:hypothetical protein
VPVGAQFGGAAVRVHGAHRAVHRPPAARGVARADPVPAHLQVDHVAFFEVDDLVGDAGQRHRVAGQEVLPWPTPSTSGEPARAPTTRCGSSRQNTAMA